MKVKQEKNTATQADETHDEVEALLKDAMKFIRTLYRDFDFVYSPVAAERLKRHAIELIKRHEDSGVGY